MVLLDSLPPEILFNVLTYTEPTCDPDPLLVIVPLNALAATNRQLNTVVEEYARNLLKRHTNIVPPKVSKTKKIFTCRRKWLGEICQFCKKNSKRKSCFYPTLTCCRECERDKFPKMTMTHVTHEYHLSKLDLFTPNVLHPDLPRLTFGTLVSNGTRATMVATDAALARRDYIHSLLGEKANERTYMRRRAAAHVRIADNLRIQCNYGVWLQWPGRHPSEEGPTGMAATIDRITLAEQALEKEWDAMGMTNVDRSRLTALKPGSSTLK